MQSNSLSLSLSGHLGNRNGVSKTTADAAFRLSTGFAQASVLAPWTYVSPLYTVLIVECFCHVDIYNKARIIG
jgi:hypothetical protein